MREDRAQHRINRAKTAVPVLALVGYTNAGKSCLMNQLTLADVLSEDALFATLDTTVRKLSLPSGLQVSLVPCAPLISTVMSGMTNSVFRQIAQLMFFLLLCRQ